MLRLFVLLVHTTCSLCRTSYSLRAKALRTSFARSLSLTIGCPICTCTRHVVPRTCTDRTCTRHFVPHPCTRLICTRAEALCIVVSHCRAHVVSMSMSSRTRTVVLNIFAPIRCAHGRSYVSCSKTDDMCGMNGPKGPSCVPHMCGAKLLLGAKNIPL
jgi:hypothetical protein